MINSNGLNFWRGLGRWMIRHRRSFTLTELLVVIGIIAVLSALTAIGFRAITKDAKLASGKNAVMAVLNNARGLAMKNNKNVLVVFRARLDGSREQHVEAVVAEFKASEMACVGCAPGSNCPCATIVDRYVPVPGVPSRNLPIGIKVASPAYQVTVDTEWHSTTHLPSINQNNGLGEIPGEQIAVLYGPDGSTLVQSPVTDSAYVFVDFNNNGKQDIHQLAIEYSSGNQIPLTYTTIYDYPIHNGFFGQIFNDDECFVRLAPYIGIFDDDKMRELNDSSRWSYQVGNGALVNRLTDYSAYITANADRIHFNRYTGVAMK